VQALIKPELPELSALSLNEPASVTLVDLQKPSTQVALPLHAPLTQATGLLPPPLPTALPQAMQVKIAKSDKKIRLLGMGPRRVVRGEV